MTLRIIPVWVSVWLTLAVSPAGAHDGAPAFKIYTEHAGVYQISYEQLVDAGLDGPRRSHLMGLRNFGEPASLWIEDGDDGRFGPGDRVQFLGEVLRGSTSYLNPYSRFNCSVLSFDDPAPLHGSTRILDAVPTATPGQVRVRHHLEADRIMVRFRPRAGEPEESWYWERLSVADRRPFEHELVVHGLTGGSAVTADDLRWADALSAELRAGSDAAVGGGGAVGSTIAALFGTPAPVAPAVRVRLGLRGWSEPRHQERAAVPHHELAVRLNGGLVDTVSWDGTEHYVHEFKVDASLVSEGVNALALEVPKRNYPDSGDLLVDVVLLNWIEVEYLRSAVVGNEQMRVFADRSEGPHEVVVSSDDASPLEVYRPDGRRDVAPGGALAVTLADDERGVVVLERNAVAAPNEVVLDRPSRLRANNRQADYIIITHRTLRAGAERLAEFHRGRGLTVTVVDVQDIYDEFNGGVVSPRPIRDFLEHAHTSWPSPSPRFVLLVGDASWDFKNTLADDTHYADWTYRPGETRRFVKNSSTPYSEGSVLNNRNLVPTSSYPTTEGHAASDTWFVCFDDGDDLPDMAIGRLPVVDLDELDRVIDKTLAFASSPPIGPWRRELLFIANESPGFQRRSDLIAESLRRRGYVSTKIYPHPSEPANEHHTRRILEVLDDGVAAVHFIGHGGRYIWRTGPPDLEKNHDLFTLEHLDQLVGNGRLPVVLSLTCYSAPFDHPTADSIGEKLIRIPKRGAIAVFAASWRNSPSPNMGQALLDELTTPGNTIGEAVMRAKRGFGSPVLVQTYNLLGDPAVPVAAPAHALKVEIAETAGSFDLRATMPAPVESGTLIADWLADDGTVIHQERLSVSGRQFRVSLDRNAPIDHGRLAEARVYVWDDALGVDGIGWTEIATPAIGDEAVVVSGSTGEPEEES